ncbi:MAG: hypothetical protein AB7V08_02475 [Elusimicrobiales bacterium]
MHIWVACIVAAFEAMCVGGLVAFSPPWVSAKSTLISMCLVVVSWIIGYWQGEKFALDLHSKKSVWVSSMMRGMIAGGIIGFCSGVVLSTREFYYSGSFKQSLQIFLGAHQPPIMLMWIVAAIVGLFIGVVGGACVAVLPLKNIAREV